MGEGTATKSQTRRRRIIERPRLTRLLDESQGRIKMLVAPAGYGKTTLARQWLEKKRAVWYTATPASTDVAALAAGVQQAVADIVPDAGDALIERLSVTRRAGEEAQLLASMLARDLSAWPSTAWLVIDDYQEVTTVETAERFVEALLAGAPINVLLLTRRRPRWASSRRILYGELFEIDRSLLAMSDGEAAALLGGRGSANGELLTLARGWPAVLALAAVLETRPRKIMSVPHLYGFFADEIYRRLDRRARRTLCELSLYDVEGREVALSQLHADEAERVVQLGLASGFLTERPTGGLELHPLVREFLEVKLREERPQAVNQIVTRAVEMLLDHGLWDQVFLLIRQFERDDLIATLVERSMDELLAAGRTATLRSWLNDSETSAPAVLIAFAELAFREARFYEAEALAALAANDLAAKPEFAARANFVAGRAAHVASREAQARSYFEKARELAGQSTLGRHAAMGAIIATIELEDPHAAELLSALSDEEPQGPSDEVLLADRRLAYETRFGLPVDLHRARAASQLLKFVGDPVVRTSFRNMFGWALASMGQLDEATRLTDEQLRDVERCRLDFVVPYALTIHAMVASGRRAYDKCSLLLDDADARALASGDLAALQLTTAVRMRTLIAQAAFDDAAARADIDLSSVTRSVHGELLGVHALALAGSGHVNKAQALARAALEVSIGVETAISAHSALSVAALNEGDQVRALNHAAKALERAVYTGMIESFVCAYRGCPQLIVCLLQNRDHHDPLALVLARAGDARLLEPAGAPPVERSVMSLSPREKEVLALLAQGMSNPAIGRALFISPVTVKVHVRHIFEKLGVRSRAEAALRGAQLNRG